MNCDSNELMHYGVLGMKWGHRKAKSSSNAKTVSNPSKKNRQLFNKKLKIDSVEAIYLSNAGYKAVRAFTIDKGDKNKMMKDLNGTTVWLGALAAYQLLK